MRCLKCGNELKDNEIICGNCGYNRNNAPQQDNQFATRNIGVYNQNPVDQQEVERKLENEKEFDELVQIYIGDKYYNFRKGKFSWCAFFLGPIYFLYRKLYAVAILIFLMFGGINAFFIITTHGRFDNVKNIQSLIQLKGFSTYIIIYSLTFLIIYLFFGFTFKKFYFNEVVERIGKIKQDNPTLGFNQLTQLVKQKGGTNIFAPVLAILIPIVLIIIILIISILFFGMKFNLI
jgi:hypothetical protein